MTDAQYDGEDTEYCPEWLEEEVDPETEGCGGYGYDYAPGCEQCEFCSVREGCASTSREEKRVMEKICSSIIRTEKR
jgi:hypothetical protein